MTDVGIHKIQGVNLNGTGLEDLVTSGLIAPRGIALDVAGGKMYWTDGMTRKIQRAIITYASGPMGGGGQRYGIALATTR